jgi:hypothetical protein
VLTLTERAAGVRPNFKVGGNMSLLKIWTTERLWRRYRRDGSPIWLGEDEFSGLGAR